MESEEYLRNVKALLSQVNDMEAEAAKRSMEEQRQKSAISSVSGDLQSVRSELKLLNGETEEMVKTRTRICCEISDKQKKIAFLEKESSTVAQTLELLRQEICSSTEKMKERSSYYKKVLDVLYGKLKDQQDWFDSYKQKATSKIPIEGNLSNTVGCIDGKQCDQFILLEENLEKMGNETSSTRKKDLLAQLAAEEATLEDLSGKKLELDKKYNDSKLLMEQLNHMLKKVPAELAGMDVITLQKEHKALMGDKSEQTTYLPYLQDHIKYLKGISEVVNCQCGKRYKVELPS